MKSSVVYDSWVFVEGVEHGILRDADGYGEGLDRVGNVIDSYILPSDIDVLSNQIDYVRWFAK